jgi:DNA-directed RNA polymerase beta subunit
MSPKGEIIKALVGIMPVSTTVHIAEDKIQKGENIPTPRTNYTRSPAGGRKDAAALRLGMADFEALAVAGSSGGIRDILLQNCDGTKTMICPSCGIMADKFKCSLCGTATIESDIRYIAILLMHACMASGVDLRLKISGE